MYPITMNSRFHSNRSGNFPRLHTTVMAILLTALFGIIGPAFAEDEDVADLTDSKLVQNLKRLFPDMPITGIADSPVPGVLMVNLGDGSTFYGSQDGAHLFAGDLYNVAGDRPINLAEVDRAVRRKELLAGVSTKDMLVFSPEGKPKAVINVFTDVDCGYCQKLHLEVPELNKRGVEVRYLAYPRAGIGSDSYKKIVSAWCADDPNTAITKLKLGQNIPSAACTNPVASQYELGQLMGVTGTPAIVLESGELIPGYRPAADLAQSLGI